MLKKGIAKIILFFEKILTGHPFFQFQLYNSHINNNTILKNEY
jgi:hypothetical protein